LQIEPSHRGACSGSGHPRTSALLILIFFYSGSAEQDGYYTKENAPPILYTGKMMKDAEKLGEYCHAHGDDDIIKAADKVMPVN
jgi:hypothetical protein